MPALKRRSHSALLRRRRPRVARAVEVPVICEEVSRRPRDEPKGVQAVALQAILRLLRAGKRALWLGP
jgi:hypothetical protein